MMLIRSRSVASSRRLVLLALLLCSLAACAGSAGFVLQSPVASQCKDAGLKQCDDLAAGVIGYAEGNEKEKRKLLKAAAANDPSGLAKFSLALRAAAKTPGVDTYATALEEVASVLEKSAGVESGAKPSAAGPVAQAADTSPGGGRGVTATVVAPGNPLAYVCTPMGQTNLNLTGSACVRLAKGPLVVTDVILGATCPADVLLTSGPVDATSWVVTAAPRERLNIHGARLVVAKGEELVLAVHPVGGPLQRDLACAVTWTGM